MTAQRILVCGAWDSGPGYPRAASLLAGLDAAGFEAARCRVPSLVAGRAKKRLVAVPWRWPAAWLRGRAGRRALRMSVARAVAERPPSGILVPYPGHQAVRSVRAAFRGPVVLDLFLSAYDTAVVDRGMFRPHSIPARLLRRLDRRACAAADLVLLDTPEHADYVADLVGLPRSRFGWVPVSDPDAPVAVPVYRPPQPGQTLDVLFFGTGVPLHGLHHLIDAVGQARGIRLTLVGGDDVARRRAQALGEARLRLGPTFVERDELARLLARAHLVAGVFGEGAKTRRVVPFKVVHGLAAGRPVLTADTPAVRGLLRVGEECAVCRPGDTVALRDALHRLAARPDHLERLAAAARPAYDRAFSTAVIGARLGDAFASVGVVGAGVAGAGVAQCATPLQWGWPRAAAGR